jgi:WD repeat-containing protein 35
METDGLLAKYAAHLLEKEKVWDAIELFKKANHFLDAAKHLFTIAAEEAKTRINPSRVKKLYVLGGILVEQYKKMEKKTNMEKGVKKNDDLTLTGLLNDSNFTSAAHTQVIDNAWKGAEAFHFYLLAQKQLYSGEHEAALRTVCLPFPYFVTKDKIKSKMIEYMQLETS